MLRRRYEVGHGGSTACLRRNRWDLVCEGCLLFADWKRTKADDGKSCYYARLKLLVLPRLFLCRAEAKLWITVSQNVRARDAFWKFNTPRSCSVSSSQAYSFVSLSIVDFLLTSGRILVLHSQFLCSIQYINPTLLEATWRRRLPSKTRATMPSRIRNGRLRSISIHGQSPSMTRSPLSIPTEPRFAEFPPTVSTRFIL